jgi:hypothetical protein
VVIPPQLVVPADHPDDVQCGGSGDGQRVRWMRRAEDAVDGDGDRDREDRVDNGGDPCFEHPHNPHRERPHPQQSVHTEQRLHGRSVDCIGKKRPRLAQRINLVTS